MTGMISTTAHAEIPSPNLTARSQECYHATEFGQHSFTEDIRTKSMPSSKLAATLATFNRNRFPGTIWMSWCQKRTSGLYGARED